jgi:hypothetical protein
VRLAAGLAVAVAHRADRRPHPWWSGSATTCGSSGSGPSGRPAAPPGSARLRTGTIRRLAARRRARDRPTSFAEPAAGRDPARPVSSAVTQPASPRTAALTTRPRMGIGTSAGAPAPARAPSRHGGDTRAPPRGAQALAARQVGIRSRPIERPPV